MRSWPRAPKMPFDSLILEEEPDHYRRTLEEARSAAFLLAMVTRAFERREWTWAVGKVLVGDKKFTLVSAIIDIARARSIPYGGAIRYLAAVIIGHHAARIFIQNFHIVRDYASAERPITDIMAVLAVAREWARDDAEPPMDKTITRKMRWDANGNEVEIARYTKP